MDKKVYLGSDVPSNLDGVGRRLLDHWKSLCGAASIPRKAQIDPLDFPYALSGIQLVDVVGPPDEFRYRLVGTAQVDARGWDPTGKTVLEGYFGSSPDSVLENYRTVVDHGAAVCIVESFRKWNDLSVVDIALFLPLTDEAGRLHCIMVYSYQRAPDNGLA